MSVECNATATGDYKSGAAVHESLVTVGRRQSKGFRVVKLGVVCKGGGVVRRQGEWVSGARKRRMVWSWSLVIVARENQIHVSPPYDDRQPLLNHFASALVPGARENGVVKRDRAPRV